MILRSRLFSPLKTYSDADFDAAWMNLTQPELESLAAILIRAINRQPQRKSDRWLLKRHTSRQHRHTPQLSSPGISAPIH
jgi:hypothetical protein